MKVAVDTNVLLRITLKDDPSQEAVATHALSRAQIIAITLPTLCEFCWVLSRGFRQPNNRIAEAVRGWMDVKGVVLDRPAVDAGLAVLDAGGDFADGVIAFEGRRLGGETFLTFDRDAADVLRLSGTAVQLLNSASL